MGEARVKSRNREEVLKHEPRCIYCAEPWTTWEHMPPKQMFRGNDRPSGMEFASCEACNNGTRAADTVASFVARIKTDGEVTGWEFQEMLKRTRLMRMHAPGVLEEIFDKSKSRDEWMRNAAGILKPMRTAEINGPLLSRYLTVFASKVGMSLFREHSGKPLPLDGKVFSQWFLNFGLPRRAADNMLNFLPIHGTLKQGKKHVGSQFGYRFNTDESTTTAALSSFQGGLYTFTIATTLHQGMDFFTRPGMTGGKTDAIVCPGELAGLMPRPTRPVLLMP